MRKVREFSRLCEERDYGEVAAEVSAFHGVTVSEAQVQQWLGGTRTDDRRRSSASWMTWFKNRMYDANLFQIGDKQHDGIGHVTGVLHFGFVSVLETPEQLARLRGDRFVMRDSVARSRIGQSPEILRPIDGLAALVAPVMSVGKV